MDKSFHEIQAQVAKRLIHGDRHRRRTSIAADIVGCNSQNHDLSRLKSKNEVLFKNLEGKVSFLEIEQRRRANELLRTERALAGSVRNKTLPHLTKHQGREKYPALRRSRRNSLAKREIPVAPNCNQLVQEWLRRFDDENNITTTNTPETKSVVSESIGAESDNEPMANN
jgi:hypothetical protein